MPLRPDVFSDAGRALRMKPPDLPVRSRKNGLSADADWKTIRRLIAHGNLVKTGVRIGHRYTVQVKRLPQNLDDDLLVAVNGEFSDIHVFWQFLQ